MKKDLNILVLTDHSNHSSENSIYALVQEMLRHPQGANIDIASRGCPENKDFFEEKSPIIHALKADKTFAFSKDADFFKGNKKKKVQISQYQAVFLRLPHPITHSFLKMLANYPVVYINNPLGIIQTSTKQYLMSFPNLCPPTVLCKNTNDVLEFAKQFPIVLKPFHGYAGQGIMKFDGHTLETQNQVFEGLQAIQTMTNAITKTPYLAVKFLKNVKNGDKRILVVNGKILAASNRLPAPNSWMCNVAQGGSSVKSGINPEEKMMIETINPFLAKEGIFMYGVDTLENDEGKRILSEINTLSIGGFPQAESQSGIPVVHIAINEMIKYIVQKLPN